MLKTYNICEVLEYGPIVACDLETGLVITASKSTFNVWTMLHTGEFVGGNYAIPITSPKGLYALEKIQRLANEWLEDLIVCGEDEPSND